MYKYKIGFIGSGNMASAIATRLTACGIIKANEVVMCDVDDKKLSVFKEKGFAVSTNAVTAVEDAQTVFLAVKPQNLAEVSGLLKDKAKTETIVSMLAGVTVKRIKAAFGGKCPIVRIMPNLSCAYGEGVTLYNFDDLPKNRHDEILSLLNPLGLAVELQEREFNAGTAISGCGPAFFYEFFKGFMFAAKELNFDENIAKKMIAQTARGAAVSFNNSADPTETMIERVCSKGGATIEGINALRRGGMDNAVYNAVLAAKKRSDELESQ